MRLGELVAEKHPQVRRLVRPDLEPFALLVAVAFWFAAGLLVTFQPSTPDTGAVRRRLLPVIGFLSFCLS